MVEKLSPPAMPALYLRLCHGSRIRGDGIAVAEARAPLNIV